MRENTNRRATRFDDPMDIVRDWYRPPTRMDDRMEFSAIESNVLRYASWYGCTYKWRPRNTAYTMKAASSWTSTELPLDDATDIALMISAAARRIIITLSHHAASRRYRKNKSEGVWAGDMTHASTFTDSRVHALAL